MSPSVTSVMSVLPSLLSSLTATELRPTSTLRENVFCLKKEQHKVTPWLCPCMLSLIERLPDSVMQVWYADDASALGSVANLRAWWDELARLGPSYGYFANPSKTWLVSKEACLSDAISAFEGTNVNVTCKGRPYLGSPLGSPDYICV